MSKFKELKVWQKAIQLVTKIYFLTSTFPKEEIYGITSQIRRCAISIPSNIAEGYGRNSGKEMTRFLNIAKDSSYELETQLIISNELRYINEKTLDELSEQLDIIQRSITNFQKKLTP